MESGRKGFCPFAVLQHVLLDAPVIEVTIAAKGSALSRYCNLALLKAT